MSLNSLELGETLRYHMLLMTPPSDKFAVDITPTVIGLMKHQARGLLLAALLRSKSRSRFEALLESATVDRSAFIRAGSLLLDEVKGPDFASGLAHDLMQTFAAIFWTEVSENLITSTTCGFQAFGGFRRFSSKISFVPELLFEKPVLPSVVAHGGSDKPVVPNIASTAGIDFGLDALCRLAMEPVRINLRSTFRESCKNSQLSFVNFGIDLLRHRLQGILTVIKPPEFAVGNVFSSVASLATCYAWVLAFDAALQNGYVSVPDLGGFTLVPGRALNRVDFSADDGFIKLIRVNAVTPPLPDDISSTDEAAA